MEKIEEAFEVARNMVETKLFRDFRQDLTWSSIEVTNLDIPKIRESIEVYDGAVYRTLPALITCMVEKMLKNNELKAYLDERSTMQALRMLIVYIMLYCNFVCSEVERSARRRYQKDASWSIRKIRRSIRWPCQPKE